MTSNSQTQYILESVIFTADRWMGDTLPINIAPSIAELSIFESIELPYLTGTCALVDDVRFRDVIGIKGSERITITLLAHENSTPIVKTFMVTGLVLARLLMNEQICIH